MVGGLGTAAAVWMVLLSTATAHTGVVRLDVEQSRSTGPWSDSTFTGVGGVDFTSAQPSSFHVGHCVPGVDADCKELSYVAKVPKSVLRDALMASLRGEYPGPEVSKMEGDMKVLLDAVIVWISLPRDVFWVNLKPSMPDHIVDPRFAATNTARILLETDILLKKAVARFLHPEMAEGKRFWSQVLQGVTAGNADMSRGMCFFIRQWILSGKSSLAEDRDIVYVESAPLDVEFESEHYKSALSFPESEGACPPDADIRVQKLAESVIRNCTLDSLRAYINDAPEFHTLRWTYYARVLAEWLLNNPSGQHIMHNAQDAIRQGRHQPPRFHLPSDFSPFDPRGVWESYIEYIRVGDFSVKKRFKYKVDGHEYVKIHTLAYGAINFTHVDDVIVHHHP